jgi:hypothetical protein
MSIRGCVFTLASLAVSLAMPAPTRADVSSIEVVQTLPRPPGFAAWYPDVAIDGGYIIVLASIEGSQRALLYRRSASTGQWVYRRVLWTHTGLYFRSDVVMRNGIAAVQFGDEVRIFEQSSGDYVRAPSTAPILHQGGLAISGNSVLIGGNDCDYDAVIYQKNAAGSWAITGRIDDNQGQCLGTSDLASVEINADYAVLRSKEAREAHVWRRNGSALNWVPAGTLTFEPDELVFNLNFALQGATAVSPNGVVWLRTGTSTWTRQGVLTNVDRDNGNGTIFDVKYRNGTLIAGESGRAVAFPRVYIEASPGHFEHVGSLRAYQSIESFDISNRTVAATGRDATGAASDVRVFTLPSLMGAPAPVVNNFEDRDTSDFTFTGGQFALATRGSDDVLSQGSSNGLAIATVAGTDWTDYQRVQADITPGFGGTGSWVGLVARHVDANNYYSLVARANQTFGIYKRVNGVDTLLYESFFQYTSPPVLHVTLAVAGNQIRVDLGDQQTATVTDDSLTHGRGGVATWMARADFDDVHVAATDVYGLFYREWGYFGDDISSGLDELSGDWRVEEVIDGPESYLSGLQQRDASGDARAVIGTPVPNQQLTARMRVDSFGAAPQAAWIGLLARYVDANNFYSVTIRRTGEIQIRRVLNGVISVLASANFTAVPGQYYDVRFQLINDQLTLYVDDVRVASAHDRRIASGRYGLATYRARANWDWFSVVQP